jgi:hypothetical protein
MTADRFF